MLKMSSQERKEHPIYTGALRYFPDALAYVGYVSKVGNDQHNPGTPLHWDRSKSMDQGDALVRHQADAGTFDSDGVRHSGKVAWRALAQLQLELEAAAAGRDPGIDYAKPGWLGELVLSNPDVKAHLHDDAVDAILFVGTPFAAGAGVGSEFTSAQKASPAPETPSEVSDAPWAVPEAVEGPIEVGEVGGDLVRIELTYPNGQTIVVAVPGGSTIDWFMNAVAQDYATVDADNGGVREVDTIPEEDHRPGGGFGGKDPGMTAPVMLRRISEDVPKWIPLSALAEGNTSDR